MRLPIPGIVSDTARYAANTTRAAADLAVKTTVAAVSVPITRAVDYTVEKRVSETARTTVERAITDAGGAIKTAAAPQATDHSALDHLLRLEQVAKRVRFTTDNRITAAGAAFEDFVRAVTGFPKSER